MTIGNEDGEQVVEFERPGAIVRFAVGSPKAHGLPWRLWAGPNASDLYLMVRAPHTSSKWSFHASGDWRLQHLPEHVEARGLQRVVDSWTRPDPDENGLVHAIDIRTPADDLAPNSAFPVKGGDVRWIPPAPAGHFTAVHVVILAVPDRIVRFDPSGYILAVIPLVDDTVAMLVVTVHAFDDKVLSEFRAAHQRALAIVDQSFADDPDARITLYGHDGRGRRFFWDTRPDSDVRPPP